MKELTNNQQEAVKLFNNHVELGDFWGEAETPTEATDYIWMGEAIQLLVKNGWSVKSAEGTIGSLMGVSIEEYDICYNDDTAQKETLYVVFWQNLEVA
tara:strand:- start:1068 stop:1361 length:294 start_codon:yes stop_codon:yes gene_type:complete